MGGPTAECLKNARGFVTLLIQCRRPEGLTTQLVAESIHRRSQLVHCLPCFIEPALSTCFHPLPNGWLCHLDLGCSTKRNNHTVAQYVVSAKEHRNAK